VIARGKTLPVGQEAVQRAAEVLERAGELIEELAGEEPRKLRTDELRTMLDARNLAVLLRDAVAQEHLRSLEARR
jgi:hypothetical protein